MNTHYHPKHGVKYLTSHVALTLEAHSGESVPVAFENDLPLCKEVVNTISIPLEQGDGTVRFVDFDKDHLAELLVYARSIEEKDPVYVKPDLTKEDIKKTWNLLNNRFSFSDTVEHFNKNHTQNEKPL